MARIIFHSALAEDRRTFQARSRCVRILHEGGYCIHASRLLVRGYPFDGLGRLAWPYLRLPETILTLSPAGFESTFDDFLTIFGSFPQKSTSCFSGFSPPDYFFEVFFLHLGTRVGPSLYLGASETHSKFGSDCERDLRFLRC